MKEHDTPDTHPHEDDSQFADEAPQTAPRKVRNKPNMHVIIAVVLVLGGGGFFGWHWYEGRVAQQRALVALRARVAREHALAMRKREQHTMPQPAFGQDANKAPGLGGAFAQVQHPVGFAAPNMPQHAIAASATMPPVHGFAPSQGAAQAPHITPLAQAQQASARDEFMAKTLAQPAAQAPAMPTMAAQRDSSENVSRLERKIADLHREVASLKMQLATQGARQRGHALMRRVYRHDKPQVVGMTQSAATFKVGQNYEAGHIGQYLPGVGRIKAIGHNAVDVSEWGWLKP